MGVEGTMSSITLSVAGQLPFVKAQRDIDFWQEEMETRQQPCIWKKTFYIFDELAFPKDFIKTVLDLHFIALLSVYYMPFTKTLIYVKLRW